MPEVTFVIRWPDGCEEGCYSPSTVIHEYLSAKTTYPLTEFMDRALAGLDHAARRVEAKYGSRCGMADAQARSLSTTASRFKGEETIECLSLR